MTYKDFEYELVLHPHKVTSNDSNYQKKSSFKMTLNGPHFIQIVFGFAKWKRSLQLQNKTKQTNKTNKMGKEEEKPFQNTLIITI